MPEQGSMDLDAIKAVLEALIYVSDEPVREEEILGVFPADQAGTVRSALAELVLEYAAVPRGLRIIQVAGGYRMQTRPEFDSWIRSLFRVRNKVRLSRAALETLAIIAYRQPVTTPEIQAIRGINPLGVIQTLLERRLVRTLGRKKVVGKPILYGTTEEFLVHFGLNSLSDLPSLEDFPGLAPPGERADAGVEPTLEGMDPGGPEVRAAVAAEEGVPEGDPGGDLLLAPLPGKEEAGPESADSTASSRSADEEE